jgi:hypothetical protein
MPPAVRSPETENTKETQRKAGEFVMSRTAAAGTTREQEDAAARIALPNLIRHYVERNLPAGTPASRVRFVQIGDMQMKPRGRRLSFAAEQEMTVDRVEFVWDARFRIGPLISLRVRDWYRDGDGGLDGRLFDHVPIFRASGIDVSRGEAMRYLAELPWAPRAMAANHALEWREIDASTIEVATFVGDARVGVMLHFDAEGDITAASADARPRPVGKESVPTPWGGTYGGYRVVNGVRVPTTADVAWVLPEGRFTYFRVRLTELFMDRPIGADVHLVPKGSGQ